jgi:transcription antitermination factor NusG
MKDFKAGWRVIYTKPRHEKKVREQLSKLELDAYLPTIKCLRKWSDRRKYIDTPLFPSYVFVHLKNDHHYINTLDIDGVLYYVKAGTEVARVSPAVIDHIRLIVNSGQEIEVTSEYFQSGRCLLIKEGPFTGFDCEVVQYRGKEKILVRIDLLQRSILLNLPQESLMTVGAE